MRWAIDRLLINRDMSVADAMRVIEDGACKTAFLVEDGVLMGVVTDGDVRRHLIGGGDIKDNVGTIVNFNPRFVYESEAENVQQFMSDTFTTALPVVDENKKIIRIETLRKSQEFSRGIDEDVPVVMMAGGKGTRLKPYTDIIPKPLIPIGNKTITEHIFDKFVAHGCNEFYMVLNYKKSLIEAYFHDIEKYEKLAFVEEPYFMGTAGGMGLLRDVMKKNFFLVNCDILVDYDYYSIWRKHVEMDNIVTIVSARKRISVPYGTIVADDDGRVQSMTEKPQLLYNVNTGMYLCNADIFRYMNKGEKVDMPDLIRRCIDAGENVGQVSIDEQDWYDMGQPKELEMMKRRFNIS
jgi:dTDP-glucose pyrophosphorylase